jgi:predicted metal-dependent HD superfamily phosphohydrolase
MFLKTAFEFSQNPETPETCWQELEKLYTHKSRHYHCLKHLENLLRWMQEYQPEVQDWAAMVFAIFYHDAVYKVLKSDNEEKSAELAVKRLKQMHFPKERIDLCAAHILATKSHAKSENQDTNLLLDVDLSILGADWNTYQQYTEQVRKEYSIYPDLIYKPGRKKVLQKFLERESIFKTPYFITRFETQARKNIQQEIDELR